MYIISANGIFNTDVIPCIKDAPFGVYALFNEGKILITEEENGFQKIVRAINNGDTITEVK